MGNQLGAHQWYPRQVLRLGTCGSPDELRKAIMVKRCVIGGRASEILERMPISQRKIRVKIVETLVTELGFKNGGRLAEIFFAAKDQGLELCPAEVGPQRCLQSENCRTDEELYIAMKPVVSTSGLLCSFRVCQFNSRPSLRHYFAAPGFFCQPDYLVAFVLPKSWEQG